MGDFTQPQQKYAGTGKNCNVSIPVIFYIVKKTLGIKFESRIQLCNYVKNCPKIR